MTRAALAQSMIASLVPSGTVSGSLVVTTNTIAGEDMVAAGYADYIAWGAASNASQDCEKGSVSLLSAPALSGGLARIAGASGPATYTGSDGTPATSDAASCAGFSITAAGSKFTMTAPAGTGSKTVQFGIGYQDPNGGAGATATIKFSLSDASASPTSNTLTTTNFNVIFAEYKAIYNAASAGQTLTFSVESATGSPLSGCFILFVRATYQ